MMFFRITALLFLSLPLHAQNFNNLTPLAESEVANINFNPNRQFDFNNDGVRDLLSCSTEEISVQDGANSRNLLLKWNPSFAIKKGNGDSWRISGCEVAHLPGQKIPSIFFSSYWQRPDSRRYNSTQQAIINVRGRFKTQVIRVREGGKLNPYKAVARSVDCRAYPQKLVREGYKPGLLCFYAAYQDSLIYSDWRTHTALFKFSIEKGALKAIDLTATSDLPWKGGYKGTSRGHFDRFRFCDGYDRYDGIHMMEGALLDFNSDGLVDLVSAGQHASLRASRMILDNTRPEGVRFNTQNITRPGHCSGGEMADMTEFLTVTAIDKHIPNYQNRCVYITGEYYGSDGNAYGDVAKVPDHIRCFRKGKWRLIHLPGPRISGSYFGVRAQPDGLGKLIILAQDQKNPNKPEKKFYGVEF